MTSAVCRASVPTALTVTISKAYIYAVLKPFL